MIERQQLFSSIDLVHQCLVDTDRVGAFATAIEHTIAAGECVVDLGSGSGILALIAARAGAGRVYAIECDPYVSSVLSENVRRNGYQDIITVVTADAMTMELPLANEIDLVTAEMLTTGLIDEHHLPALNNLYHQGLVGLGTKLIPKKVDTWAQLVCADYCLYGFEFRMVRHLWQQYGGYEGLFEVLSEKSLLNSIDFDQAQELEFTACIPFEVTRDGIVNGLYLTSIAWLTDTIRVSDTLAMNAPVLVPLCNSSSKAVTSGQRVDLRISYRFGGGYERFCASLSNE